MTVTTITLPPTCNFPTALATFVPTSTHDGLRGSLEIRGKAPPDATYPDAVRSYVVKPTVDLDYPECHAFVLRQTGTPKLKRLHVTVNPDGLDECDCVTHGLDGVCDHTRALRGVLEKLGAVPPA